jgi:CheY-like chemotaxis protein
MRVLVVDDESLITSSLQVFLEDEGISALAVESGEKAVEILQRDKGFDVCIMDMRLPGMDGNEAIRLLHEIAPSLRFIVHTGSVDYIVPKDLERLGIREEHIFQKPLSDMHPIAEAVRSLQNG